MNKNPEDRWYRNILASDDLKYFDIKIEQSDLYIASDNIDIPYARKILNKARDDIKMEISKRKEFLTSLEPLSYYGGANDIVSKMYDASMKCNVGPMAAVAGATAQYVGEKYLKVAGQVIVENGGDLFIKTDVPRKIAIYAGKSVLSNTIAINIAHGTWGICTSAATVGHSYSMGNTDAAICIAHDTALADAAATRLGNMITDEKTLAKGVKDILKIDGIIGAVAIIGEKIAIAGDVTLSPI
ncbi:MAG: UPF0280 family protein [Clostridiales bacterium]|nr:UPF0280 family protein [Clostridiales bacterium]